jgi:hypothetical protein
MDLIVSGSNHVQLENVAAASWPGSLRRLVTRSYRLSVNKRYLSWMVGRKLLRFRLRRRAMHRLAIWYLRMMTYVPFATVFNVTDYLVSRGRTTVNIRNPRRSQTLSSLVAASNKYTTSMTADARLKVGMIVPP